MPISLSSKPGHDEECNITLAVSESSYPRHMEGNTYLSDVLARVLGLQVPLSSSVISRPTTSWFYA